MVTEELDEDEMDYRRRTNSLMGDGPSSYHSSRRNSFSSDDGRRGAPPLVSTGRRPSSIVDQIQLQRQMSTSGPKLKGLQLPSSNGSKTTSAMPTFTPAKNLPTIASLSKSGGLHTLQRKASLQASILPMPYKPPTRSESALGPDRRMSATLPLRSSPQLMKSYSKSESNNKENLQNGVVAHKDYNEVFDDQGESPRSSSSSGLSTSPLGSSLSNVYSATPYKSGGTLSRTENTGSYSRTDNVKGTTTQSVTKEFSSLPNLSPSSDVKPEDNVESRLASFTVTTTESHNSGSKSKLPPQTAPKPAKTSIKSLSSKFESSVTSEQSSKTGTAAWDADPKSPTWESSKLETSKWESPKREAPRPSWNTWTDKKDSDETSPSKTKYEYQNQTKETQNNNMNSISNPAENTLLDLHSPSNKPQTVTITNSITMTTDVATGDLLGIDLSNSSPESTPANLDTTGSYDSLLDISSKGSVTAVNGDSADELDITPRRPGSWKGSITHSREDLSEGRGSLVDSPAPLSPTPSDADSGICARTEQRYDTESISSKDTSPANTLRPTSARMDKTWRPSLSHSLDTHSHQGEPRKADTSNTHQVEPSHSRLLRKNYISPTDNEGTSTVTTTTERVSTTTPVTTVTITSVVQSTVDTSQATKARDIPVTMETPSTPPRGADGIVEVILEKGAIGLGFCIEGGKSSPLGDRPITVKRLFKGNTPAQKVLRQGDEIISVAGESLDGMNHYTAWNLLKSLPAGDVNMVLRRK